MADGENVILVTGANRGIGLAIVKSLATSPQIQNPHILMGCRDVRKGQRAIDDLRQAGVNAKISPVVVDVTSDDSIRAAVRHITTAYARLDVLVNNAGFAVIPSAPDHMDVRAAFTATYDTNVTSVAMTTYLFLPLLRACPDGGKVVNVSSGRSSISRSANGQLPPTVSPAYSISKTALNALTIEMSRSEGNENVEFQLANPGHCKTEFNGYRGTRDPAQGANVVIELVAGERRKIACWETYGDGRDLVEVPW